MPRRAITKNNPPTAAAAMPKSRPAQPIHHRAGGIPLAESDEDLMQRAQAGDRQSFSILYERYRFPILSYLCRAVGNREDAESIGQDVFVRALRFAPTYRHPHKFSTWLFTIARNLAINSARRRVRKPVRNSAELNLEDIERYGVLETARNPDRIEQREEIGRVLKAMEALPAVQREVIALRVFQDCSYSQMEQILGTKAVTLRSRVFHGLRTLSTIMSNDDVEMPVQ